MKKTLTFVIILILICCKRKQIKPTNNSTKKKQELQIDNSSIKEQLEIDVSSYMYNNGDIKLLLPFNYSIIDTKGNNYTFKWDLCDLKIDNNEENYNYYSFKNLIPYDNNAGDLHFVKTNNSNAITIEKFKKLHSYNYSKIYYQDYESIIFKTYSDDIAVLFFRYLEKTKTFAIYYKENRYNKSEKEALDDSIFQLRVAKNIFKLSDIKNTISNLKYSLLIKDKRIYKQIYEDIKLNIDSLEHDEIYTPKLKGNYKIISAIKLGDIGIDFWEKINENRKTSKNNLFFDKIPYFREKKDIKLKHKESHGIILEKEYKYPKSKLYIVLCQKIIKGKKVILFTGSANNQGRINSKELAYFYLNLLKNYEEKIK